ncbi:hypothetical protein ACF8EF_17055 [Pseudomonas sp. zjy_15]|uniref:hypothetical protein n=1 Tax=Pseudomonas sp. zjy_15 TaxID=3367265 RepID=UPI00370C9BF8
MEILTLEKIETVAMKYNLAFGPSTIASGPKTKTYKLAIGFILLTVIFMVGSFAAQVADSKLTLPLCLVAATFELITLYLLARRYEPEYRQFMLKKHGILDNETTYSRSRLEDYKSAWLKRHINASEASYLEIVENLDKVITLSKSFKENALTLGESIINHIFSIKLFRGFFTLGFVGIAMNATFRILDNNESLKAQAAPYLHNLTAYTVTSIILAIYCAAVFGMVALAWRASRDFYLERRRGKCSKNSLNFFVQALLKRATLPIYDARLTIRAAA